MMSCKPTDTPIRAIILWILAAIAGACGLVLAHGFHQPVVPSADLLVRIALMACLLLFAFSRLLMLFPACGLQDRLGRWWVDYVLLIAGVAWWCLRPASESFVLHVGAAYVLVVGAATVARAAIGTLADPPNRKSLRRMAGGLVGFVMLLVLVGGSLLSLPACRRARQAVESDHQLAAYQLRLAWTDSTFTAAAALTGTGLAVQDVGYYYNRAGQLIVLVLMQLGGLGVLAIGAVIGLQLRHMLGWGGIDDDTSPRGLRRAVLFIVVFALLAEAIGAVGIYRMWDPAVDLNFATASREPELLGSFVRSQTSLGDRYDEARLFAAVFHSVSAFCGVGLTLTRDGYMAYRQGPWPYLALMPLMLLGSLGGPVLQELLKRMTRRSGAGLEAVSKDTIVTLIGSVVVIVAGAGLLVGIESTRHWQQRYPKANTPGRLLVGTSHAAASSPATTTSPQSGVIDFAAITAARAAAERISGMPGDEQIEAALFQAEAARVGGVHSVRLDENSMSPAGHLVMMGLMLVGGGVGGTTGGLRIIFIWLLIAAMLTGGRPPQADKQEALRPWNRMMAMAAAMLASMMLLVGVVCLVLIYCEAGSFLACVFEAVSACCSVGLSLGLTPELSVAGRVTIILAMLFGRLIPLVILMRCLLPVPAALSRPLVPPEMPVVNSRQGVTPPTDMQ